MIVAEPRPRRCAGINLWWPAETVAVIIGVIMTYPPQQPPPGPDPYGQPPNPYGQQWGGTQPGGFPVGPPPPKPKTGLIAALIIGAIVLVGGGGAGAYLLLSKEDGDGGSEETAQNAGDPKTVAKKFATEFEKVLNADPEDVSLEPLKPLVCSGDLEKLQGEVEDQQDQDTPNTGPTTSRQEEDDVEAKVSVDDFRAEGDKAEFTLVVGYEGERDITEDATMAKADGGWQVCGLYDKDDDSGGGATESSNNGPPPNPVPTS